MSNVNSIIDEMQKLDIQINKLTKQKNAKMDELSAAIDDQVKAQLSGKDYGCGTANIKTDKFKISVVISKNVKWSQEHLRVLTQRIADSGQDPAEYIKAKYEVSETKYNAWPEYLRKDFEPARTVEQSKPKITITAL